jgi:hypothetical protein
MGVANRIHIWGSEQQEHLKKQIQLIHLKFEQVRMAEKTISRVERKSMEIILHNKQGDCIVSQA